MASTQKPQREDGPREARSTARADADQARGNANGSLLSAEEQRLKIRKEWQHEALPSVPDIPGFHFCWLSTTNSYDPIHKRMRLGYVPVKAEEIPEFKNLKVHSGEWAGCVSANEMLLFKIPADLYQAAMAEFHFHAPREEEERLRRNMEQMRDGTRDSSGRKLGGELEEGHAELGKGPNKEPIFQP